MYPAVLTDIMNSSARAFIPASNDSARGKVAAWCYAGATQTASPSEPTRVDGKRFPVAS